MTSLWSSYPGLSKDHNIFRVQSYITDTLTRIMRYGPSDYVERMADAHRFYRRRYQAGNRPREGQSFPPIFPNESYKQKWMRENSSDTMSRRQRRKTKRALSELQTYYDKYGSVLPLSVRDDIHYSITRLQRKLERTRYDGRVDFPDTLDTYASITCSNSFDDDKISGEYRYHTDNNGERKLWRSEKGFAVSYNFNATGQRKSDPLSYGSRNRLEYVDAAQRRVKADLVWNIESAKYKAVQYIEPSLADDIPF